MLGPSPALPVPHGVALVLRTSGSTDGVGRPVALPSGALLSSADATHQRLGGAGRWVLTLPPRHIAGVQVLLRSVRAGTEPVVVTGRFDPERLGGALLAAPDDAPLYLSLVPTQLHRALAVGGEAVAGLQRCAAVLVGGAAAPAALLEAARAAEVRVVTTYGMTETCGGCVYDGEPLRGVSVGVVDGRIRLGGAVVAAGYLDDGPQPFVEAEGIRWFLTSDAGEIDGGRLRVLGRADDVIVTGGVNVHPAHVERLLDGAAGLGEIVVVGVPDEEWGARVTVVVTGPASLREVRDAVGGGPSAPRALVRLPEIPTRGPGKPDRRAAATAAAQALAEGLGERL